MGVYDDSHVSYVVSEYGDAECVQHQQPCISSEKDQIINQSVNQSAEVLVKNVKQLELE